MNLAHLHLVLNHWPIIGTFMAVGLFIAALAARSEDLKEASLTIFSLLALLAIPAYISGSLAQDVMQADAGVSQALMAAHQGAALLALLCMEITGLVAWSALWQTRRDGRAGTPTLAAVLATAVVTVGVITVAGNTGGAIRHPEILSEPETTSVLGSLGVRLDAAIQHLVTGSSRLVWPVLETLHFIGLALVLGVTGVLNLRVLGFVRLLPIGALYGFMPWAIAGLAINILTGMLFFIGMPYFYIYNADLHLKVFLVLLAGANLLLHCTRAFAACERLEPEDNAPVLAKCLAASSIILWLAVVLLGRYMPYFEETLLTDI
jgi:hypothetical protein